MTESKQKRTALRRYDLMDSVLSKQACRRADPLPKMVKIPDLVWHSAAAPLHCSAIAKQWIVHRKYALSGYSDV